MEIPKDYFEAVPNVSEARNVEVIDKLRSTLLECRGIQLLDVDSQVDANRTVFTYVGQRDALVEASLSFASKCYELIDLRTYSGEHPFVGALDVLPFIPFEHSRMNQAIEIAQYVGQKLASRHGLAIYLYGEAGGKLSLIRKGNYAGLKGRQKELPPTFGIFSEKLGASCVGARDFLIAYNVNLKTKDRESAKQIAREVRKLPGIRAIGWFMESYGHAQVSMNIIDYRKTNIVEAFEACRAIARERGIEVDGSELIGLIPMQALPRDMEVRDIELLIGTSVEARILETRYAQVLKGESHPQ